MYASLPISPRKARHFPPRSGEADTKEEKIIFLLFKCDFDDNPCRPRMMENKGKNTNRKPSPFVGKQANHFSRSGATLQKWVRRFALAKVAAELTEGARVSRYEKQFLTKQQ